MNRIRTWLTRRAALPTFHQAIIPVYNDGTGKLYIMPTVCDECGVVVASTVSHKRTCPA